MSEKPETYTQSLHIGAIFIVLFVSALGTVIPLLGSHSTKFAISPFVIVLGKCMGTGVVIACGLIHMLQASVTV